MPTLLVLYGIAALLAIAVLAVVLGRRGPATPIVYGASAAVSAFMPTVNTLVDRAARSVSHGFSAVWL